MLARSLLLLAMAAGGAQAADLRASQPGGLPGLIETVGARHDLPLGGQWRVVMPEKVVQTTGDPVDVAVTLYALEDAAGIRALMLTQRNVLPGPSGWGPPSLCTGGTPLLRLDVYQSPRDILCGWAQRVSFRASDARAHVAPIADIAVGAGDEALATRADKWLLIGWRVSNRNDFFDLQLLLPDQPATPLDAAQPFVADVAHSLDATWLAGTPSPVPMPAPKPAPPPEATGSRWSGTLSASAMKTATYRVGVSIKTFAVASLMAGNAATGGAIIGVLNITSTGIYLVNDYIWERWYPLTPSPQDFVQLVEAPR